MKRRGGADSAPALLGLNKVPNKGIFPFVCFA